MSDADLACHVQNLFLFFFFNGDVMRLASEKGKLLIPNAVRFLVRELFVNSTFTKCFELEYSLLRHDLRLNN